MTKSNCISLFIALITLININCLAINNYLTEQLPKIMHGLNSNTDDLITQRRTIDITKQALDTLLSKKEISELSADQAKKALELTFKENLQKSTVYQRAMYNMKRPFQFVYNKITDPNASYLERFAYGAAAAVGVAVTGYTMYQGGKYIYSVFQDIQPNQQTPSIAIPEELTSVRQTLPSAQEITQRLMIVRGMTPQIRQDISKQLAHQNINAMGIINIVEHILEQHAAAVRPDRQFEILWLDTNIVHAILHHDDPERAEIAAKFLAKITR